METKGWLCNLYLSIYVSIIYLIYLFTNYLSSILSIITYHLSYLCIYHLSILSIIIYLSIHSSNYLPFCRGFSSGGPGWGHRAHGGKAKGKEWIPVTRLGRLVKDTKIKSLEEIYLFWLPIKESETVDFFPGMRSWRPCLCRSRPQAGQQTRFKAFVATGTTMGTSGWELSVPKR
jgi:hypothetical protein